jgi:hypothetical protein
MAYAGPARPITKTPAKTVVAVPKTPTRVVDNPPQGLIAVPRTPTKQPAQPPAQTHAQPQQSQPQKITPATPARTVPDNIMLSEDELLRAFEVATREVVSTPVKPNVTPTKPTIHPPADAKPISTPTPTKPVVGLPTPTKPVVGLPTPTKPTVTPPKHAAAPVQTNAPKIADVVKATPSNPQGLRFDPGEIANDLVGYHPIPRQLWHMIPEGSQVRFFKRGTGAREERYRPGGYIKSHNVAGGMKIMMMQTCHAIKDPNYLVYPMRLDDLEEVWKKWPKDAFVELTIMNGQIRELMAEVEMLKKKVAYATSMQ